jgi:hypothetical protein
LVVATAQSFTSAQAANSTTKPKTMPRYFFNIRIGEDLIPDPDGEELRDPDHAWAVARAMIRQLLAEQSEQPNLLSARLEVTDQAGEVVLEFPFAEAIMTPEDEPPTTH